MSAERALAGVRHGRDGADRARVRGLGGRGTPCGPLKRWPPPPPSGRWRRRTRRLRKDRRSTAPTVWERSSQMGTHKLMRQCEGKVQVWRVAKARTFSRSTMGLKRYSQRAATLRGRHTCEQEPRTRSSRRGHRLRAQGVSQSAPHVRWPDLSWPLMIASGLGHKGRIGVALPQLQWGGRSGGLNHPSPAERVLESRQRETKLPERLNTLDAVAAHRVCSARVKRSWGPARRREKEQP